MKSLWLKIWPATLIVFVVLLFHIRLFLPEPSMYTTPDFGRSDFVNFNIPMKYVLKESLKDFKLPLWEKNIGQGFPVFAEGQVGALYPPNIILFGTLPLWLAFNLSIIVAFLTAAFGTYLLARSLNVSKAGALLAAFTYTFSPIIVLHQQHLNLAQTAAIFPWQILFVNNFFKKKELRYLIYLSAVTSFQILAGFQQIVVYSILGLLIVTLFQIINIKKNISKLKIITAMIAFLLLSISIAAIQLLPTYELMKEAQRSQTTTPKSILTDIPFKPINLKTFINPYALGSPVDGSYPQFRLGTWGIFWEGNAYAGLVPMALLLLLLIKILIKNKNNPISLNVLVFSTIGLIGILLALGKEAPLHVLFSFPPFSLFRVPSRFLLFTFAAIAILAGIALDKLIFFKNKKVLNLILGIVLLLVVLDSFRAWFNYHLTENVSSLTAAPTLKKYIDSNDRLFSYGAEAEWTTKYFYKGWDKNTDIYSFLRNTFSQNSNILYGISQNSVYAGMSTRRSSINIVTTSEHINLEKEGAKIDSKSQTLLNANNVRFLTTTVKLIDSDAWQLLGNTSAHDTIIYLYQNNQANSRVYVPINFVVASTVSGFRSVLEEGVDISKTVFLEEEIDLPKDHNNRGIAQITSDENTEVKITTDLKVKSLVTLSDSYYPGWKAYVDGEETKIFPTNVNSRSVVVPAGKHEIIYKFESSTVKTGALITGSAITILLFIFSRSKLRNYRFVD